MAGVLSAPAAPHNVILAKSGDGKCEGHARTFASIAAEVAAVPSIGRMRSQLFAAHSVHQTHRRPGSMQRRYVCTGILGGVVFPASMVATAMPGKAINSSGLSYAQACLVEQPGKLLFISGQVPAGAAGTVRPKRPCRASI